MADGFRRIRAVNEQARLVQQQRACAQRTAGAAGRCTQRCRILRVRHWSLPVRPLKLAGDTEEAAALLTLLSNTDAVAPCRIVRIDQVEKAVLAIDHDRSANDGGAIEHHLALKC